MIELSNALNSKMYNELILENIKSLLFIFWMSGKQEMISDVTYKVLLF